MMLPSRLFAAMKLAGVLGLCVSAGSALAQNLPHREPPEGELRLGQRVYIDDGSCPAGQVKQVTGARLTPQGIVRERECVSRKVRR